MLVRWEQNGISQFWAMDSQQVTKLPTTIGFRFVLGGVFGHDYFYEDASAWNIFRVNLESNDSGVSHKTYNADDTHHLDHTRNTALG